MTVQTYSYNQDAALFAHFCAKEFQYKCGASHSTRIADPLIEKLEALYGALDCSKIIVNSGYRCESHDKAVGGSGSGQHTKWTTADVVCYDASGSVISSKRVCCAAQDLGFPGIANINAKYQLTHLDVRSDGTYYGDETKGTSSVTTDFYAYFGIAKSATTDAFASVKVNSIDVSQHQGAIDWDKVHASGKVDFVMIHAGYGKESIQIDAQFETNYAACKRLGIPCGAYWYSYTTTAAEAKQEAKVCLSALSGKTFAYPIAYDIEETKSQKAADTIAAAFCGALEEAWYYAMIYSYKSMLDSSFSDSVKQRYDIWVAQWASNCTYSGNYGIWQYNSTGSIPGIDGDVDLDCANTDYPALLEATGLNGFYASSTAQADTDSADTLQQIFAHVSSIDEKMG